MSPFESRAHLPIPGYEDHIHSCDGEHAWQNFQGKDILEAGKMFLEMPDFYQEDFMFMGTPAFCYYFPILDRYIRSLEATGPYECNSVWILSCCIGIHFDCGNTLSCIREEVIALCDYVLRELDRFVCHDSADALEDRLKIEEGYTELRDKAIRHIDGQRPASS